MEKNKTKRRKRIALVLSASEAEIYGEGRPERHDRHQTGSEARRDRCYLCGRVDGERGVAFQNDPDSPVAFTTVRLSRYRVDLLERFALDYLLCFECAALIHAFEVSNPPAISVDEPAEDEAVMRSPVESEQTVISEGRPRL